MTKAFEGIAHCVALMRLLHDEIGTQIKWAEDAIAKQSQNQVIGSIHDLHDKCESMASAAKTALQLHRRDERE